jgi:hypothetical protein
MLTAWITAAKTIEQCVARFAKDDVRRKRDHLAFLESLISRCGLRSDVHSLSIIAAAEAPIRYANRLSPGFEDADKTENSAGDVIIWMELLQFCKANRVTKAILLTNDTKRDWVYTPRDVVLPSGGSVSRTNPEARGVKLPNPDLVAEFRAATGSTDVHVLSIESVIEVLSSVELNTDNAKEFRHMAMAVQVDLARTPNEAVMQWFLRNPEIYKEAIQSVCRWERCPSEVDQEAFRHWTAARMREVDPEKVDWGEIFCQLFI